MLRNSASENAPAESPPGAAKLSTKSTSHSAQCFAPSRYSALHSGQNIKPPRYPLPFRRAHRNPAPLQTNRVAFPRADTHEKSTVRSNFHSQYSNKPLIIIDIQTSIMLI